MSESESAPMKVVDPLQAQMRAELYWLLALRPVKESRLEIDLARLVQECDTARQEHELRIRRARDQSV